MTRRLAVLIALLAACGSDPEEYTPDRDPLLDPWLARDDAPDNFRVRFETTKGDFLVDVHRDWAPHGAERFYNLVRIGYYTDCAFYRVTPQFAQFGFNGEPPVNAAWATSFIAVDRPRYSNRRGFVSFAQMGSPERRTTQIFVNKVDNTYLDRQFPPIGEVVEGMEVVDALHDGYGDAAPTGTGPVQSRILYEGNEYLKKEFPELDYIKRVSFVE